MKHEELLTTDEAAAVCRVKPQTLKQWRMVGAGPAFIKVGRLVRYRAGTLSTWLEALPEQSSTMSR